MPRSTLRKVPEVTALDRFRASAVLAVFIVAALVLIPQRAATHPGVKG